MPDNLFFYALCILAFLSPFYLGTLDVFPLCTFMLASVLLFTSWLHMQKYKLVSPPALYIFLAYCTVILISAVFAPEARWSTRNALFMVLFYSMFFMLPLFIQKKESVLYLLKCLVFSGFCVSLYGLGIYILYGHSDYFIFSTFLNPNECAGYLILLLPVGLAIYLCEDNVIGKYRFFLLLTLSSLCLILTGSRAAWASVTIAFLVFAALINKSQKRENTRSIFTLKFFFSSFAVLLLFLLMSKAPLLQKFLHLFSRSDRSLMFRLLVWEGSLRMLHERFILGFGPGSFEWWYPHFKLGGALTKMAHNTYLHQSVESGIAGFFFFMLFMSLQMLHAGKTCLRANGKDRLLLAGIFTSSLAFLLHNMFDYTFYIPATGSLFFLLAGCFHALARQSACACPHADRSATDNPHQEAASAQKGTQSANKLFYATGFVFFVILSYVCVPAGISDYYVQKAWDTEYEKDFKSTYVLYKKAARFDPNNAEVLMQCGVYARYYKEYAYSEDVLRRAVAIAPSYAAFHNELGFTLLREGRKKEALNQLEISASLNQTSTMSLRALGQIYFSDALEEIKKNNMRQAFFCLKNALHWYEKINALSRSVYESDLYEPLAGRERNKDFKEAENMIKTMKPLMDSLKEKL